MANKRTRRRHSLKRLIFVLALFSFSGLRCACPETFEINGSRDPSNSQESPEFLSQHLLTLCEGKTCQQPDVSQLSSFLFTDSNTRTYDPWKNVPEMSYAYEKRDAAKEVYLSALFTKESYSEWKETCLAEDVVDQKNFLDCYKSEKTRLTIHFEENGDRFRLAHQNKCLSLEETLKWIPCDANDQNQYFYRVYRPNGKFNSYLEFTLKSASKNVVLFDGTGLYFRDAFPLMKISSPIHGIPKKPDIDSFFQESTFTAQRTPNIIIIALDTTRADIASSYVMPNLYDFAVNNISFKKYFASATATETSAFTIFNSRPPYEFNYYRLNDYNTKASFVFRVLRKLGYKVDAFSSYLYEINDGLFDSTGRFYDGEEEFLLKGGQFSKKVFAHRSIFDFEKPKENRIFSAEDTVTKKAVATVSSLEVSSKIGDIFQRELSKSRNRPVAFVLWSWGSHVPWYSCNFPGFSKLPVNSPSAALSNYAEVSSCSDFYFGRILRYLKDTGQYDNSIIVVLGDHGESMYDYGRLLHGGPPMQKIIEAPIYYRFPPVHGKSKDDVHTEIGAQMDLFPTLFDYLGLEVKRGQKKQNLSYFLKGRSIFKNSKTCAISGSPIGWQNTTAEIAIFNGTEKLRARLDVKEITKSPRIETENFVLSENIEILAYTDYWDRPLNPGYTMDDISHVIRQKFDSCFKRYFQNKVALQSGGE